MRRYFTLFSLVILPATLTAQGPSSGSPYVANWSSTHYGPDGPWNAVSVFVGDPPQSVDLMPGGTYASWLMGAGICANQTPSSPNWPGLCVPQQSGLYDWSQSQTADDSSVRYEGQPDLGEPLQTNGSTRYVLDTFQFNSAAQKVLDSGFNVMGSAYRTLPNGTQYPLTLGSLSFGAPTVNQTFSQGEDEPPLNASMTPIQEFLDREIPSASVAVHFGSVNLGISPSMVLGGFDQSRVLGSVISRPIPPPNSAQASFTLSLIDIRIGTAEGASPFANTSQGSLLQTGDSGNSNNIEVSIESLNPYLSLPKSTCDAIAANLPVQFDPGLGLYLWEISDSRYVQIIDSASYLSFVFTADSTETSSYVNINVPWKLLNLSLDVPILGTPTPYFPCSPYDDSLGNLRPYALGRAFLQSAFFAVNWRPLQPDGGVWFLAQAPGPNYQVQSIVSIQDIDKTIPSSQTPWASTWDGHWSPLPNPPTSSQPQVNQPPVSHPSLSSGVKAGVGIGCVVAGLLLSAGIIFGVRRVYNGRKTGKDSGALVPPPEYDSAVHKYEYAPQTQVPVEAQEMEEQASRGMLPVRPQEMEG